jgi:hypothetical protein
MQTRSDAIVEDVKLEFARQLYHNCLQRYGTDHEQTRKLGQYVAELESSSCALSRKSASAGM